MLYKLLAVACAAGIVAAQTAPDDSLRFEVASLKPSLPNPQAGGIIRPKPANNGYIGTNMTLRSYLMIAYTVRDTQISGGPAWFGDERYDLDAKAEKPGTIDELHIMLRNLLADRCHLKLHMETKEQSGYALVIDKGNPRLTQHDPPSGDHPPIGGGGAPGKVVATNVHMNYLALFLSRIVDRPVVDKTGLTGFYDFRLEFAPERPPGAEQIEGPSIFEALKQQLGLRLDATKAPSEHIVIDSVEKPTAN
jgi:uncharacterized protein (TIGR03435 family)